MKKSMTVLFVTAMAAATLMAAPKKRSVQAMAGNEDGPETSGRDAKVLIDQMPKPGQSCCLAAPSIQGASMIGQCYTKPRRWIVVETKYTTYSKFLD